MTAQGTARYADVAKKVDDMDAELASEDCALAALEADLQAAEVRIAVAEARCRRAQRAVERDDAAGNDSPRATRLAPQPVAAADGDEPADFAADKEPSHLASNTARNAGARTDKEVSSSRWLAARAAESRVRDRAAKARERLRLRARDRKALEVEGAAHEVPPQSHVESTPKLEEEAAQPPSPAAEAELADAEEHLQELIRAAEAHFAENERVDAIRLARGGVQVGAIKVDEDEAERLEARHDPDVHRESRGMKNASALPPKVLSHERYVDARGRLCRERTREVRARESRREAARDVKQSSALAF